MATAYSIILGSLTALVAIAVITGFIFAFVVAPLLAGGGFVLLLLLYQVVWRRS